MPRITITGVAGRIDGVYDLDLDDVFTGDELHTIKRYADVRVGQIGKAMAEGDYDLILCLAKIAMERNGKEVPFEALSAAKVGAIQFEQTDAEKAADKEDEELPPVSAPSGAPSSSSETPSSGHGSSASSGSSLENGQPVTGVQALPIGSVSGPRTSAP